MRLRNIPEAKEIVKNSPFVIKDAEGLFGKWQTFTEGRPLHLEIGAGKGRFLMEMARREPGVAFVGVERYESVLLRALEKMEGRQAEDTEGFVPPENLRFLSMDARDLPAVFAEGEVARIYLNFSDPWPKARHEKRRLTSRSFLSLYEKFLADGGILEFKTDNRDLFEFSVGEFEAAAHWTLTAVTRDLHGDPVLGAGNIMTEYERKFSALGNKICKLVAVYNRGMDGDA